jgi:hypothetical protein
VGFFCFFENRKRDDYRKKRDANRGPIGNQTESFTRRIAMQISKIPKRQWDLMAKISLWASGLALVVVGMDLVGLLW